MTLLMLAALSGCARRPRETTTTTTQAAPLSTPLVAYLSEARAQHHRANLAEAAGDSSAAIDALRALTKAAHPDAPEVSEVLADTFARIAALEVEAGGSDAALADVGQGLSLPAAPYFRGHLLEIQGTAYEARATALAAAGQADGAREDRQRAARSLHEAIAIQDDVVRRALADGGSL